MSKNVEVVLEILKNEVDGDIGAALKKMAADYSMTWMYQGKSELFPESKADFEAEMKEIYPIKGRKYEIKNIAEGENVVMVELIESYPDPQSGQLYQTPLVLVLEMEEGKLKKGRHYCDPRVSYMKLSQEDLDKAYKDSATKQIIK
jgi:ketosteroid isomerase-like protein